MVLKFAEFEIKREQEQPFEKPVDKPYKDNPELGLKKIVQLLSLQILDYPVNTKEHQAKLKIESPIIPYQMNLNPPKS